MIIRPWLVVNGCERKGKRARQNKNNTSVFGRFCGVLVCARPWATRSAQEKHEEKRREEEKYVERGE